MMLLLKNTYSQLLYTMVCIYPIIVIGSEKILYMAPLGSLSEANWYGSVVKELHSRGHQVTYVTSNSITVNDTNKSLKQIVTVKPLEMTEIFQSHSENVLEQRKLSKNVAKFLLTYSDDFVTDRCHETFQNPQFIQDVLNKSAGHFDLVIFPGFFHQCFYGLVHKFQAPFIIVSTVSPFPWLASHTGSWSSPSFVPVPFLDFKDNMDFSERFINSVASWLIGVMEQFVSQPKYTEIYKKYLGSHYPSSWEIEQSVSLILANSHFSTNYPRPSIHPSIIEIGGFHCRPAKKLSKDLEDFVSKSDEGFIYFSFGTVAKGSHIPKHITQMFINVFSRLKQRILWKFDNIEGFINLPENIKLSKWFPQADILGHPKIRCFITQGGIFSTHESIYNGVPVLGIPIIVDQDANINRLVDSGSAISLEILTITEGALENALREILDNSSYSKQAKKLSALFRDRPESPVSTGMYWIDYITKHKGAKHIISPARELNFVQYFSLDVIAVIFIIFIVLSIVLVVSLRSILKRLHNLRIMAKAVELKKLN